MCGTRCSACAPRACDTVTLTERQHALQQRDDHEKQIRAEAAGRERVGAERAEQDRVGDAHRHLRELRDGERRGEPRGVGGMAGEGSAAGRPPG